MSRDVLFVIVEGRRMDPLYYDRLCESSVAVNAAGYQVWLVEQTNGGVGGKDACLAFYDHCRRARRLRWPSPTGTTAHSIAFMLDRDLDGVNCRLRRSPHVIYTQAADVEAEIFNAGDDATALGLSLSLGSPDARLLAAGLGSWRSDLADNQREWIELCAVAGRLSARCSGIGLSHKSLVNSPNPFGPVDPAAVAIQTARVLADSQFNTTQTARREADARARVANVFRRGRGWTLVKGRVAPEYLLQRVRSYLGGTAVDLRDFTASVAKMYLASIDFTTGRFAVQRASLEALL